MHTIMIHTQRHIHRHTHTRASQVVQGWRICLQGSRWAFNPWLRKIPWKRECHSSIVAWQILWTEEPGRLHCPRGWKESDMTEVTEHAHMYAHTQMGSLLNCLSLLNNWFWLSSRAVWEASSASFLLAPCNVCVSPSVVSKSLRPHGL